MTPRQVFSAAARHGKTAAATNEFARIVQHLLWEREAQVAKDIRVAIAAYGVYGPFHYTPWATESYERGRPKGSKHEQQQEATKQAKERGAPGPRQGTRAPLSDKDKKARKKARKRKKRDRK